MVDGGGAVKFLEEYERKIPNSLAFNSGMSMQPFAYWVAKLVPNQNVIYLTISYVELNFKRRL